MPAAWAPAERACGCPPSGWEVRALPALQRPTVLVGLALVALLAVFFGGVQPLPPVTFTTLAGERISAADLHGKVVLVSFWATTCEVCVREMPQVVETYRTYAPRGFEVIAVAMPYDRPDWVVDYAGRNGLPFRVTLDYDATINRAFGGIEATPTSFLIDKRGKIIQRIVGQPDFVQLRAAIERELARRVSS
jgi:peroxiredoxin